MVQIINILCIIVTIFLARSSALNKVAGMHQPSTSSVEGLIVETLRGASIISLPSLQHNISLGLKYSTSVAFDWKSRKVYWKEGRFNINSANADGTDVESFIKTNVDEIAVDSISGNVYYYDFLRGNIRVCSGQDKKCSIVAVNQTATGNIKSVTIALHSNRGLMLWVNGTSTYRANMDGTDVREFIHARPWSISVDEDEDRVYWIDEGRNYIASSDLNGSNLNVLLNGTYIRTIAVDRDVVYFSRFKTVYSVSKNGGAPVTLTNTTRTIWSMTLYGNKTSFSLNPCSSSICSHLCLPKLKSFACLCPQGRQLEQDGLTCL